MSKKSKAKLDKKKRRERQVRLERNQRRSAPVPRSDEFVGDLDLVAALEELPTPLQFERIQRRISRTTGQRVFARNLDALDELEKLKARSAAPVSLIGTPARPDAREDAQDLALLSLDPANEEFVDELTSRALELDPENVDAASQRAVLENLDIGSMVRALEAIVARAEHALGDPAIHEDARGSAWNDVLARPWLRARRKLAEVVLLAGRRSEAAAQFAALLDLDPRDPLDTVDFVLGSALERKDLDRARTLIPVSDESGSPVARWALALERWLEGDRARASDLVRRAQADNGWIATEILERGSIERERSRRPSDFRPEDAELGVEAESVDRRIGAAWRAHAKALAWLADGASVSTREERELVCSSFAPPVSSLLEAGEAGLDEAWLDYAARFGLRASHVPEVLRMATDPGMHELDGDDRRALAAPHAWRALGTLGAAEAAAPLLELAIRSPEDDLLHEDLPQVFTRIGDATLAPLINVLADVERDFFARELACDLLAQVAADHPERRTRALTALANVLARAEENDPELNGSIVAALVDLRAVELAPEIRGVFERELVDETISGDWKSVAKELGVPRRTHSRGRPGASDAD